MSSQDAKAKVTNELEDAETKNNKEQHLVKNDEESRDSTIQSGASIDDEDDEEGQDLQDEDDENDDETEETEEDSRHAGENGANGDHKEVELNGTAKNSKRVHDTSEGDVEEDPAQQKKKRIEDGADVDGVAEAVSANE